LIISCTIGGISLGKIIKRKPIKPLFYILFTFLERYALKSFEFKIAGFLPGFILKISVIRPFSLLIILTEMI